jgi:hypothetical protein
LQYLSLILLSALASGLLLLLAWFLLPAAALLPTLTRLLFLLAGLLTTTTLLAALAWILISHDHVSLRSSSKIARGRMEHWLLFTSTIRRRTAIRS